MNRIKSCLLSGLIFAALARGGYSAPTLPDPGTRSTATYTSVSCDYGPRNFGGQTNENTNPHVGIDYAMAANSKGHAVLGGNITTILIAGDNSLIQIAGNWEYVHMQYAGPRVQVSSVSNQTVLVFREAAGGPAVKVLGVYGLNYYDGYFDPISKTSLPVRTSVTQNEWIYAVRANHLHLEYRNGQENPFRYVTHKDDNSPAAMLTPKIKRVSPEGIAADFVGAALYNTPNPLILQAGVNTIGDKDLNKVEISIMAEGAPSPEVLNLWTYEPTAGRSAAVNSTLAQAGKIIRKSDLASIASASEEGVYPQKEVVSNDFFKLKWDTLASKNPLYQTAPINSLAKYPDGGYALSMSATDITGHVFSTSTSFSLDNFRPYVQRVRIRDVTDPGAPGDVYDRGWALSGDQLSPVAYAPDKPALPGHTYDIAALMSEYTNGATISLENGPGAVVYFSGDDTALHISSYNATLQVPGGYTEDKLVPLVIGDSDYNGNQLLALAPDKTTINPALELTRNAEGIMRGIGGSDKFHYLRIDAAPPVISYNRHSKRYSAYDYTCPGGIPERCGTEENPINITFSSVPFLYTDLGSGVKSVMVYKDHIGGASPFPAKYNTNADKYAPFDAAMTLKDGKYVQVVTDNLGRGTTMRLI